MDLGENNRDHTNKRSSSIYFTEGLKGYLPMNYGNVSVDFQDVVRFSPKLIELGEDAWGHAVYPMEDYNFKEPSIRRDKCKRNLKLFKNTLTE